MLDGIGYSSSDWQNQFVAVNLPADPVVAALLIVEIAGRRGRTPGIVRWRVAADGPGVEPGEVISLHEIRKEAPSKRKGWSLLGGRSSDRRRKSPVRRPAVSGSRKVGETAVPERVRSQALEIGVGFSPLWSCGENLAAALDDFAFFALALGEEDIKAAIEGR